MLAITPGEPAGIGPDLVVQLAQEDRDFDFLTVGSAAVLRQRADLLGLPLRLCDPTQAQARAAGELTVLDVPVAADVVPGRLDTANVPGLMAALDAAIAGVRSGRFAALVTGPMQKSIVNEAGVPFSGHTEYLCQAAGVADVVMLLVANDLRVALATTHLPLRDVADALTRPLLERRLNILHAGLQSAFGIEQPSIAVTGLNPHAGEGGHLGREEIEIIAPVVEQLAATGMQVSGPYPADTLFTPERLAPFDAVLAMFHDQGLPVLKYAGFGNAVNVTVGLDFVRTSVDHGTALDIAGRGNADVGSLRAAVALALEMTTSRRRAAR